MKKLAAIGEALIDFIPCEKGCRLKAVTQFKKAAGGAPANVAGAFACLGGESVFLSKLGEDAFGESIIDALNACGVDTRYIKRSKAYDTSLAFVSLADDGNRDFKFYRKTEADLNYDPSELPQQLLPEVGAVHFCSVDLVDSPMKEAHRALILKAIDHEIPVCFDVNLRLSLWESEAELKQAIDEFLPLADILKLSDEELFFVTHETTITKALPQLFANRCQWVLYTKGSHGAELYSRQGSCAVDGIKVEVCDTTGAGDAFIGAFLYAFLHSEKALDALTIEELHHFLQIANAYAALMTTRQGALASMAKRCELERFMCDHGLLKAKKK